MSEPTFYRGYEIVIEAFQHRLGRRRGAWSSSFKLHVIGGQPTSCILAASAEKTVEVALDKALCRAKTIIDDREENRSASHSRTGRSWIGQCPAVAQNNAEQSQQN